MDSISSSHEPAGGLHFLALTGGVDSAGWAPFLRERFVVAAAADAADADAPVDALPRFLPRAAFSVSSKMLSRPPMALKYSSSTPEADSLSVPRRVSRPGPRVPFYGGESHIRLSSGSHVMSDFFSQPSHLTRNLSDPCS